MEAFVEQQPRGGASAVENASYAQLPAGAEGVPRGSGDSSATAATHSKFQEKAERAADQLDELLSALYRVGHTTIRERPIVAVAIAGAVGVCLALAVRRSVR